MTGTLFGCLAKHKALKDCRWDYETYTCNYCTMEEEDADLEYHVVTPEDKDDFDYWTGYYQGLEADNRYELVNLSYFLDQRNLSLNH